MTWKTPEKVKIDCDSFGHRDSLMRDIDLNHLSFVQFLYFLLHEYTFSCYFFARTRHPEQPGNPLQENHVNLNKYASKTFRYHKKSSIIEIKLMQKEGKLERRLIFLFKSMLVFLQTFPGSFWFPRIADIVEGLQS